MSRLCAPLVALIDLLRRLLRRPSALHLPPDGQPLRRTRNRRRRAALRRLRPATR
jgi:hypothetical protein